jgi:hypothetical protein
MTTTNSNINPATETGAATTPNPSTITPSTTTLTFADLTRDYQKLTCLVTAECTLATDMMGGVPADDKLLSMYVKHQLGLAGDEAIEAIARIKQHEIGTVDLPYPEGEINEQETKSVNVIRRDDHGPWIGDWMIKANLRTAASRIGLFSAKLGSKGDMAEMGSITACGVSRGPSHSPDSPHGVFGGREIYLRDHTGTRPAPTEFRMLRGRVATPQGPMSIVTMSEACLAGARFAFQYRFYNGKISDSDVADIFASAMVIGLGSAKAFECGKFRIDELRIERGEKVSRKVVSGAGK